MHAYDKMSFIVVPAFIEYVTNFFDNSLTCMQFIRLGFQIKKSPEGEGIELQRGL